jgi:hypothetical protein
MSTSLLADSYLIAIVYRRTALQLLPHLVTMKYLTVLLALRLVRAATIVVSDAQSGWDGPNAVDNNPSTFWHSVYSPSNLPLPHTATIDLGNMQLLNGFNYLPRQDGNANGRIGQFTLEASTDNSAWTQVASGTWVDDPSRKHVGFPNRNVRYLRIKAITEAGSRGPWTSAAEFGVNVAPTSTVVSAQYSNKLSFLLIHRDRMVNGGRLSHFRLCQLQHLSFPHRETSLLSVQINQSHLVGQVIPGAQRTTQALVKSRP